MLYLWLLKCIFDKGDLYSLIIRFKYTFLTNKGWIFVCLLGKKVQKTYSKKNSYQMKAIPYIY